MKWSTFFFICVIIVTGSCSKDPTGPSTPVGNLVVENISTLGYGHYEYDTIVVFALVTSSYQEKLTDVCVNVTIYRTDDLTVGAGTSESIILTPGGSGMCEVYISPIMDDTEFGEITKIKVMPYCEYGEGTTKIFPVTWYAEEQ
jgi:hypothetical protein